MNAARLSEILKELFDSYIDRGAGAMCWMIDLGARMIDE